MRQLAGLGFVIATVGCAPAKADSFFIRSVSLADSVPISSTPPAQLSREERDFLPVRGHRLTSGHGVALAYRRYSAGSLVAIDDETFEKVTVWLPDSLLIQEKVLDLRTRRDVVVRYSRGGSAWPGAACYGTAAEGQITLRQVESNRVGAQVTFTMDLAGPSYCGRASFRRHLVFVRRALEQLTPWDGRSGSHIYEETYPESDNHAPAT